MVKIPFTKMHGIGNDFIIINQISVNYKINSEQIKKLSNRNFGIGFDQLLIIEKPSTKNVDFKYRIFNSDGNEVEQCGNGARCFFRYILYKGLSNKPFVKVETINSVISLSQKSNKLIEVDMGSPKFDYQKIPYKPSLNNELNFTYGEKIISFDVISMGNPHAIIKVNNFDEFDISTVAKKLQNSDSFPEGVNVGFLQINNRNEIRLKVYERGSGLTLACGSGACAAAVIAIKKDWVNNLVNVILDGGQLEILWDKDQSVIMSGPAEIVYEGFFELDE